MDDADIKRRFILEKILWSVPYTPTSTVCFGAAKIACDCAVFLRNRIFLWFFNDFLMI